MAYVTTFCDMEGGCRLGAIPVADLGLSKRGFKMGAPGKFLKPCPLPM